MSAEDVQACVSAIVPCARVCWPEGLAPELPWAVFTADRDETFMADNSRFADSTRWCLELYERYPDQETEDAVASAIGERFGPYLKTEAWVESEGCYMTALYFRDIEKRR